MIVDFHTHVFRREHFTEKHKEEEEAAVKVLGNQIGSRVVEVDLDSHFRNMTIVQKAIVHEEHSLRMERSQ